MLHGETLSQGKSIKLIFYCDTVFENTACFQYGWGYTGQIPVGEETGIVGAIGSIFLRWCYWGAAVERHSFQNVLLTLRDDLTVRRPSQLTSEQDSLCAHMRPSPHNYYMKSFCHNRLFKESPLRDELSVSPWIVHQNYQLYSGHIFLNIQGV